MATIKRFLRAWLLGAAIVVGTGVHAQDSRVYVTFQPGAKAGARAAVAAAGGRVHHEFDRLNAVAISVPTQALAGLSRNPNVVLVEEDPIRELLAETVPYGITLVQATELAQSGIDGSSVKVGVIDSGVYTAHADLSGVALTGEPTQGSVEQQWNRDYDSHGTHVTGTIAAAVNGAGVVGVAPGVSIHMVKVFGDLGQWIYSSDLLAAVNAAVAADCRIINMSLGGRFSSRTEQRGLADVYNQGILLVAAAGNDGGNTTSYPAGYASVISVAAVDENGMVADFSQQNATVELAAPGVSVLSTTSYHDETTLTVAGTPVRALHVEFSARGSATGALVYGGLGDAPPANGSWAGKVVLVDRGGISFNEKVQNVEAAGGAACIIANNTAGDLQATLGEGNTSAIVAVGVTQEAGADLKNRIGQSATVANSFTQPASGYDYYNGTSMATPHVSGVAALLWSEYPQATAAQIRAALQAGALDRGPAGRDKAYGYGLVQAKAALDHLATELGDGGNGGGGGDPTTLSIPSVTSARNGKSGSFTISFTTSIEATGTVTVHGLGTASSPAGTTHSVSFKGRKGQNYTYTVSATAGDQTVSDGPHVHAN